MITLPAIFHILRDLFQVCDKTGHAKIYDLLVCVKVHS